MSGAEWPAHPSRNGPARLDGALVVAAVLLMGTGCAIPMAVGRPPDTAIVPQDTAAALAVQGRTRDEVRALLGEPERVGPQDAWFAYTRTYTGKKMIIMWVITPWPIPLPGPGEATYRQTLGIWFDATGRVIKTKEHLAKTTGNDPKLLDPLDVAAWMAANRPPG